MAGLRSMCRICGGMTVTDADGNTIEYVWDYANNEPRVKGEMSKEQLAASKKAKKKIITKK